MADSDNDSDLLILNGKRYWNQKRWSKDKKINIRTAARHRELGLPWLLWSGEIWIGPEDEADAYIASRVRRRNPPRCRRQAAATAEISA